MYNAHVSDLIRDGISLLLATCKGVHPIQISKEKFFQPSFWLILIFIFTQIASVTDGQADRIAILWCINDINIRKLS